jgi:hypothetical protein
MGQEICVDDIVMFYFYDTIKYGKVVYDNELARFAICADNIYYDLNEAVKVTRYKSVRNL